MDISATPSLSLYSNRTMRKRLHDILHVINILSKARIFLPYDKKKKRPRYWRFVRCHYESSLYD